MKTAISLITTITLGLMIFTAHAADEFIVSASPETVAGAKTVSNTEAKALFDKGVLFVDVRSAKGFKKGRIPDALFLDLKKGFSKESLSAEAGLSDPIAIYCQGPKCKRASVGVKKALSWGFKEVYYYRDGFPGWKKEGYPVEAD